MEKCCFTSLSTEVIYLYWIKKIIHASAGYQLFVRVCWSSKYSYGGTSSLTMNNFLKKAVCYCSNQSTLKSRPWVFMEHRSKKTHENHENKWWRHCFGLFSSPTNVKKYFIKIHCAVQGQSRLLPQSLQRLGNILKNIHYTRISMRV